MLLQACIFFFLLLVAWSLVLGAGKFYACGSVNEEGLSDRIMYAAIWESLKKKKKKKTPPGDFVRGGWREAGGGAKK